MKTKKIVLVGCGALMKTFYQPVLQRLGIKPFALVDPDLERTKILAKEWGAEIAASSIVEIIDNVDAAIIASPNYLHASQANYFLEKGKHVLLEKPMTVNSEEAFALIETAKKSGAVLQIAMMRRFWKLNIAVKKILENNILGKMSDITMLEGGVLSWPAQSIAMFDKQQSLGGVLIDTGSHTLDLLCWWVQDTATEIKYKDDNKGGVETNCTLSFRFTNRDTKTEVALTRIRNLPNNYKLVGEKGWISVKPFGNLFETSDTYIKKVIYSYYSEKELTGQTIHDVFYDQVRSWLESINTGLKPAVEAESVLPSIQLIESCYNKRSDISYPWN